jgi:hypothetical protein
MRLHQGFETLQSSLGGLGGSFSDGDHTKAAPLGDVGPPSQRGRACRHWLTSHEIIALKNL